jgi:predicted Zn-ribbon and HTH transcriptional regulator
MATQDEIMAHILQLVGEGAEVPLTSDVESALRGRYYGWIVKKPTKVDTTPQQVWEKDEGSAIQRRLRHLGKELRKAHDKLQLDKKACDAIFITVETASDCPHCPDPIPTPGI